jgi:hypothetical protein
MQSTRIGQLASAAALATTLATLPTQASAADELCARTSANVSQVIVNKSYAGSADLGYRVPFGGCRNYGVELNAPTWRDEKSQQQYNPVQENTVRQLDDVFSHSGGVSGYVNKGKDTFAVGITRGLGIARGGIRFHAAEVNPDGTGMAFEARVNPIKKSAGVYFRAQF